MQGYLRDMSIADLIQHTCLDRKKAALRVERNGQSASLFFAEGNVAHAELKTPNGIIAGEEAVYPLLSWEDGSFNLEMDIPSPRTSITRSWSGLLLEGARRLDETGEALVEEQTLSKKEAQPMSTKKKGEILAEMLAGLLEESSDIDGVAIVGTDGLVYSANVPQRSLDESIVGAVSAAVFGVGKRSAQQLKRGGYTQTLIQGDDGNIIVSSLNEQTLFVGLTPKNVNLGMAFAEVRAMSAKLREIL